MIDIEYIRSFFPPAIARESRFDRYMLKEYLQLLILDHLTTTPYVGKMAFIGGTNLRLIQGIDRFSEDLDFDCKDLSEAEFMAMTDSVVQYLRQNNVEVETRDKPNPKLTAFRRNLYFPQMLFNLGLTGHRDERLLLKIEASFSYIILFSTSDNHFCLVNPFSFKSSSALLNIISSFQLSSDTLDNNLY